MHKRMSAALVVSLAFAVGACGKAADGDGIATAAGTAKPSTSATVEPADDQERMLKYAQCMRQNGLPDFKDPEPGKGVRIAIGPGHDKTTVDRAMQKCTALLPNGGEPPRLNAEQVEQARQLSRCMRENGVPKFPDPDPNGQLKVNGNELGLTGPDDPRMKKAENLCSRYQPKGIGGDGGPGADVHGAGGS